MAYTFKKGEDNKFKMVKKSKDSDKKGDKSEGEMALSAMEAMKEKIKEDHA